MKKILVPIDGSENSKRAISMAREIAEKFDSTILLLNIIDLRISAYPYYEAPYRDNIFQASKEQANELLKVSKESMGNAADKVETLVLEGNAANEIIDYVNNNEVDLVIMGSHGMSGIQRFFLGSVTNRVLHHIKKPILIIR